MVGEIANVASVLIAEHPTSDNYASYVREMKYAGQQLVPPMVTMHSAPHALLNFLIISMITMSDMSFSLLRGSRMH